MIDVCHLDEAGFAMTLPTCYSWFPQKERLTVPYEAPQGRRVNAIGAYFSHGPEAGRFVFETRASVPKSRAKVPRTPPEAIAAKHGLELHEVGALDAEFFLAFLWKTAGRPERAGADGKRERPLVVSLDNYSVHKSETVAAARGALEAADVHLFYLPSYSPELSRIEPIGHAVKYRGMSDRSHTVLGEAKAAVDQALQEKAVQLWAARSPAPLTTEAEAPSILHPLSDAFLQQAA